MTEITEEYILQATAYKDLQRNLRQLTTSNYINLKRMSEMYATLNNNVLESGELNLMLEFHNDQLNKVPGTIQAIQGLLSVTSTWMTIVKAMSDADPSLFPNFPKEEVITTEDII